MSSSDTRWASRIAFVFAASAAAIGLGNIWRFPFMVGENGGGAFVILYLACVIILGIPLLISEVVIGRIGRKNPALAVSEIATQSNHTRHWGWMGGLTILAGYLILTYYVVITGWVLDYTARALLGQFAYATEQSTTKSFLMLQANPWQMLLSDTIVVAVTMVIIIMGIKRGLERAVMFMFPGLLILMIILLIYAITTGYFGDSLRYLFSPNFKQMNAHTLLMALGQAFFSLNIAMGVTIMFSAYLPEKTPIFTSAVAIAVADTAVAIFAGLIIFPIVFANHLKASAGPSLIFKTLPIAFGNMPFGSLIGTLFFLMLFFAAFTSVIALLEPSVAWLMETFRLSRTKAVAIAGITCWLISLATIASFSAGKSMNLFGYNFFEALDFLTAGIMLPLGGILIAIFTGWIMLKKLLIVHLQWNCKNSWYRIWQWMLRYFAPLAILLVLLSSFGIF